MRFGRTRLEIGPLAPPLAPLPPVQEDLDGTRRFLRSKVRPEKLK